LIGGCKTNLPNEEINHGKTTRYICREFHCNFDLFRSCFDAYQIINYKLINSDGVSTYASYDVLHKLSARHYCGRSVGKDGYSLSFSSCTECTGICGLNHGCQCIACYQTDVIPRVSKHTLSHAMEAIPGVSHFWGYNGIFLDGGCHSNVTDAFTSESGRYRCSIDAIPRVPMHCMLSDRCDT